jgi:mRNA interferase MazF
VISLPSNTERIYPGEAPVRVAGQERKAMANQIMTADKRRLKGLLGEPSQDAPAMVT